MTQALQLDLPLTVQPSGAGPLTVLLDDFESPEIRLQRPDGSLLWSQHESGQIAGRGSEETTTEESYSGSRSLKITLENYQFYPHITPRSGNGGHAHHYVQPPSDWQTDTFNRMRFWIKLPPGITEDRPGFQNMNIGTYLRKSDGNPSNQEDGGGHWYHFYNLGYTGEWHQVILDSHPTHERGASGSREHGDQEYVTGEPGVWNYFDALTRFYINIDEPISYPSVLYLDAFEFYEDTNPENVDQVYSLNGVYVPSSNTIKVGWSRRKDESTIAHEVRYAFSDIHTGWNAATPAPGAVTSSSSGSRNTMGYETDQVDVTGHSNVFIAIKPENSNLFRQIVIPIRIP